MKLELKSTKAIESMYLKVLADVRYWDDGEINGVTAKKNGEDTPLKDGIAWSPTIRLSDGVILDWPQGITAKLHYKVCDAGNYYLLNDRLETVASRENNYVPDCLAVGSSGYGDYIIMSIDAEGKIIGWCGSLDEDDWTAS